MEHGGWSLEGHLWTVGDPRQPLRRRQVRLVSPGLLMRLNPHDTPVTSGNDAEGSQSRFVRPPRVFPSSLLSPVIAPGVLFRGVKFSLQG